MKQIVFMMTLCVCVNALAQTADVEEQADPLEADQGEIITVTGSLNETPLKNSVVATEVVTRAEIEDAGAQNVAEVLEDQPGIELVQGFRGQEIRVLGLSSKHVLILINGERAIGRINGGLDLERISALDIERIEIVKGAGSVLYGSDAMGGVINIITRQASRPLEAEVSSTLGGLGTQNASGNVGVRQGPWTLRLSAGFSARDAFDLSPETPTTTSNDWQETDVATEATYLFAEDTSLTFDADYSLRDSKGIDQTGLALYDRVTRTETASAALRGRLRLGKHRLSGRARYAQFKDQFLYDQHNTTDLDMTQLTKQELVRGEGKYDVVLGSHLVSLGVDSMGEFMSAARISKHATRFRLGVFAQDEWMVSESQQWSVAPGIRFDSDSQFGRFVTPKIATRYAPVEQFALRASYGFGFRAPDFKELYHRFQNGPANYDISGNPELEPETSRTATLGVELKPAQWLWTTASVFHTEIKNLIGFNTVSQEAGQTRFGYDNFDAARTRGVEVQVRVRPLPFAMVEGTYTLTDTLDKSTGRPLPNRAKNSGTLGLTLHERDWGSRFRIRGRWSGRRPFQNIDDAGMTSTVDASRYTSLDARASQDIWDRTFTVFAGVKNLLDEGDAAQLPIQPRTFFGGLTARY